MTRQGVTAAGAALTLLAVTAASASAYPSRVEDNYRITTTGGPCDVTVVASTEPGVAVAIGALRGSEFVHCEGLNFTPYYIDLSGGFSSTSLDPLNALYTDQATRHCEWQKACYWSRSKGWFPPGDHSVRHEVHIDVAPYAVGDTFLSYPQQCHVAGNDRGHLECGFTQWVTMATPAAPASP